MSSDAFTRCFDAAITNIPRKMKCIDDVLSYDDSIEAAFWHTYSFLETCSCKGITLNPEKFRFCQRETTFFDYSLAGTDAAPQRKG